MYFEETLIFTNVEAETKEDVLRKMSHNLYEKGLVKETYKEAVLEREKNFATGLPTNYYSVALPHTDVEHVNKEAISVAVLKNPVPFGVMGGEESEETPVKVVFLLAMNQKHSQLELLKRLMQLFSNEEVLMKIVKEENKTVMKECILDALDFELKGGEG